MIKLMSRKIVFWQIRRGFLREEDSSVYLYAYEILFAQVIDILISFAIAALFDQVLAAVVFLISYIPLRIYAGGNHARTHLGCGIISAFIMVCVCVIAGNLHLISNYVFIALEIAAIILIISLTPVADSNKPLALEEQSKCKNGSFFILAAEVALIAAFIPFDVHISYFLVISNVVMSVSLVTGWLKNRKNGISC